MTRALPSSAIRRGGIASLLAVAAFFANAHCASAQGTQATVSAAAVAAEIRAEATRPNQSAVGRPLPLTTHWSPGAIPPTVQLGYVGEGHHLLLMFNNPNSDRWAQTVLNATNRDQWLKVNWSYYESATEESAKLGMPIGFVASQWECTLIDDKLYHSLPPDQNPAVIDLKGNVTTTPDPMGPVDLWYKVGREYTDNETMKKMEELYPNPPLVAFYSNNEEGKLAWQSAETSKRYVDQYGMGRDKDFMHKVIMDGYVERYRALQKGMREGLTNPNWRKNAVFIGYDTFGTDWCRAWDGGTPSYYVNNWQSSTDYTAGSPQVYLQNGWIPMLKKMREVSPNFRFEMSTWDGSVGGANDKRQFYLSKGQSYGPDRYEGYVQFGLWMLQPRVMMEFRGYNEPLAHIEPYYMSLMHSVDRIYNNPDLQRFWRHGELVPNRAHPNPVIEMNPPKDPKDVPTDDRWFMLDTSLDAPRPWKWMTPIPVYSLAYVLGTAPRREWLVLAYAPLGARTNVKISLPDYGDITVDAPETGSFYLVSEQEKTVKPVVRGGPASVLLDSPASFIKPGEAATFAATNPYVPGGKLTEFAWNFGDGSTANGPEQTHSYQKSGTYLASLKASDQNGDQITRSAVVLVGGAAPDGMVLNYTMLKTSNPFLYDGSGKGNLGFMNGGTWVDDPQRGNVLQLNGTSDYVGITNTPDINIAASYANRTIMLWFKADAIEKKKRQCLYKEGGGGNGMNIYLDGAKLYGGIWEAGQGVGTFISDDDDIVAGQWYHAAIVLRDAVAKPEAGKFEMYVNGANVEPPANDMEPGSAAAMPDHVGDITFGNSGGTRYHDRATEGPGEFFAGRLGGLAIYNRALSPNEIQAAAE